MNSIPTILSRNFNDSSTSTWISSDPSKYVKTVITNKNKFAISYTDNGDKFFYPKSYTNITTPNFLQNLYIGQINNRIFKISGIEFSDYYETCYNWTEQDFIKLEGFENGLSYVFQDGQARFRTDLNIFGRTSDPIPVTTRIKNMDDFAVIINKYLDATVNNQNKLKFVKVNDIWTFISTNDYVLQVSRPLQALLFGQQQEYNGNIFNTYLISGQLQLFPQLNRSMIIKFDDSTIVTIPSENTKNFVPFDQLLSNSKSVITLLTNPSQLFFYYQIGSNFNQGTLDIGNGLQFTNLLMGNQGNFYREDENYTYFDWRPRYQPNISPKSITIHFEEYITVEI